MPAYLRSTLVVMFLLLLVACGESGSVDTPTAAPSPSPIPPAATAEPADAEKVLTLLYWQAPSLPGPYLSAGTKDSDAGAITLEPGIDPQRHLSGPLCKHIQTRENNWSLANNARSCSPEYDGLFAQLEQTRIGPERAALVKQLNDVYVQGYYEIPLVNRGFVSAHLNTLKGVRINGWDSGLWNIAEWRR